MTDEVVSRLHRLLVQELRRRQHPEDRPLKVSEIYQSLVPYRSVRSELGVELNADYEHALLRLLAGERDLLRLEPAEAREELRQEVDEAYPFVGLFRKFSASNVWVNIPCGERAQNGPDRQPPTPGPEEAEPRAEEERHPELELQPTPAEPGSAGIQRDAPRVPDQPPPTRPERIAAEGEGERVRLTGGGGASPAPQRLPMQLHPPASESAPSERLTTAGASCAFCGDELPAGRRVRFCPHCGGDQRLRPCPRCDAVLEREWRYCISCGHETGPG